jgi:hypothetical protein
LLGRKEKSFYQNIKINSLKIYEKDNKKQDFKRSGPQFETLLAMKKVSRPAMQRTTISLF